MDVNNYLTEEFEGFNDSDEVFYNKEGTSQMHLQSLMKMVMKQTWPIIQTMNL